MKAAPPNHPAGIALLLIVMAAAGCGQKGPLYLPGQSTERVEPGLPVGQEEQPGPGAPTGKDEPEEPEDPAEQP